MMKYEVEILKIVNERDLYGYLSILKYTYTIFNKKQAFVNYINGKHKNL